MVVAGNAVTVGFTTHRLIKDKKCHTTEEIVKQIEELKGFAEDRIYAEETEV